MSECKHGSLARSCEICERDAEINRLRAENERLMDGFEPCDDEIHRMAVELIKRDKRITELERELNPDPEAHLMGWEGDDE